MSKPDEDLGRALDAFCEAYGHGITWREVFPILARASGAEPGMGEAADWVKAIREAIYSGQDWDCCCSERGKCLLHGNRERAETALAKFCGALTEALDYVDPQFRDRWNLEDPLAVSHLTVVSDGPSERRAR